MAKLSDQDLDHLYSRLASDFEFWCAHCCKIRTKAGEVVPFILNKVQKRFLAVILRQIETTGRVRVVVLKARQQGLSTVIMAYQYWRVTHNKAQKGLVMAHEADSTTSLFDMYRRCHDNQPEVIRPATKYSSRTELSFPKLDSALRVATAGGRGVARGETLQTVHLSEVAFWPTVFANDNFGGLIKAVPSAPGTAVFVESTANGMVGKFRELWVGAVEGRNEFEPFFSAWFESDEYRAPIPVGFKRTPEEDELAALYDLDNRQLAWRRIEIARDGLDHFHQECPSYADEAFISTGAPVFDPAIVNELLKEPKAPEARFLVTDGLLTENSAGELLIYRDARKFGCQTIVDPKETYVIGADVGLGIRPNPEKKISGKDYSVAQILDSKMRQVAMWRGYAHPDYFAIILRTLGHYFNEALVCPERNNHGLLTCVRLRDMGYPMLYTEQVEGQLDEKDTINIGVYTTERLKPLMIDKLRAALRRGDIKINDPTTLREMLAFVVTESGKMEGDGGSHDDTVMALAIATHVHDGVWEAATVTDEFYVEAI